jgi:hypothetical protein
VPIAQQAKGAEQVDLGADAPMTNTVHLRAESAIWPRQYLPAQPPG